MVSKYFFMKNFLLLFSLSCFFASSAFAQPSNDNCTGAIPLPNPTNFCSANAAYNNLGATGSGFPIPACFTPDQNDVWYTFVATGTDITITVRGKTSVAAGGTLIRPEIALYQGTCSSTGSSFNELRCDRDVAGNNIISLYKGGLTVGDQYYLRIKGTNANVGSFQICTKNYFPPAATSSDCKTGSVLCDKSSFVVQSFSGIGVDPDEANGSCLSELAPSETNSTWYKWTAKTSGTLSFVLSPTSVEDDLDFAVYQLPNGLTDCTGKILERCEASGDFTFPSPCMGPTGLRDSETDISEGAGCSGAGHNAFVKSLDMVAGRSYCLIVNNFTSSGNGFAIDFGGTGEFLGPEAKFNAPKSACPNESVTFADASSFGTGTFTDYIWNFGADAVPATANTKGPHAVTYPTSGVKTIVLSVTTSLGCRVSFVDTIRIFDFLKFDTIEKKPGCGGLLDGKITLIPKNGVPPFQYNWKNMGFTSNNFLENIGIGIYDVEVKDARGCLQKLKIDLSDLVLELNSSLDTVQLPKCRGDKDGIIRLNITTGNPPYSFNFGSGFQPNNTFSNLGAGTYTINVLDAKLCTEQYMITVPDPPLLTLGVDTADVTCYGLNDGKGIALPVGGGGKYTYKWSNGQTTSTAVGLAPGNYSVTITDKYGCQRTNAVSTTQPPQLFINPVRLKNIICYGDSTGEATMIGSGGFPPFSYSVNGINFQTDTLFKGLKAGNITLTVRDSAGCKSTFGVTLTQSIPLVVDAGRDTLIDLGQSVKLGAQVLPLGAVVTYAWTPTSTITTCTDCPYPTVMPTRTTYYTIKITDESNCTATDRVKVAILKNRPIYIPNSFTPNSDGVNDGFTVFGNEAAREISLLRVYDRWGNLLFETRNIALSDPRLGWDGTFNGKALDTGVYVYYAEIKFIDGDTVPYKGDITLVK